MTDRLFWLASLAATLAAYQLGLWLYQRAGRRLWLHPLLTGAILVATALKLTHTDYAAYRAASEIFYLLLGLATVALALPLHREFHHLKGLVLPILASLSLGSLLAPACALAMAWAFGASAELLLALAPKSVTTPIALAIANSIGANASLTTGVVIFTGVAGALTAPLAFRLAGLKDPRAQGLVLGLNAHGVGTARAFELSPVTGAFASLAMGLTGALTAVWLPTLARVF